MAKSPLDTVGFRTWGGSRFLNATDKKCAGGGGGRGKIKAVCGDLGHCSLLFKSDPNAVYLPPNAVYWLQGSFQRSSLLPLLSFAASPPFKPEKNNTSFLF